MGASFPAKLVRQKLKADKPLDMVERNAATPGVYSLPSTSVPPLGLSTEALVLASPIRQAQTPQSQLMSPPCSEQMRGKDALSGDASLQLAGPVLLAPRLTRILVGRGKRTPWH